MGRFMAFEGSNRYTVFLFSCLLFFYSVLQAQLKPAGIFANHAVMQQGIPIPVWGKALPKAPVTISFAGNTIQTTADEAGRWKVNFPAMKADGNAYDMVIKSQNEQIVLKDILLGEVWLASGQSNMAHKVGSTLVNKEEEIKNAHYPFIRFRTIDQVTSIVPEDDISTRDWLICNPSNVGDFSAVAYFFARELHIDQKIPVGIIVASRGATSIESWMSKDRLITHPDYREALLKRVDDAVQWNDFVKRSVQAEEDRNTIARTSFEGLKRGVTKIGFDDAAWTKTAYPLNAANMGYGSYWGLLWLRKTFSLTKEQAKKEWKLWLPLKDQDDVVYMNEQQVSKGISKQKERSVAIENKILKAGNNALVIRMYANWGIAEVGDRTTRCYLKAADGEEISLMGTWAHENKIEPAVAGWQDYYNKPTVNFNGMIHPLIPYGIKGFLWYQGENNASKAMQYETLQPMLIDDWRVRWQLGYLPFLYVQLANYKARSDVPVLKDDWAQFRDAQTTTLFRSVNTGMACAIDIGDEFDIHPANKQDVGKRLYKAAKEKVYHTNAIGSGPMFKDATRNGSKVLISFEYAANGLISTAKTGLSGFALMDESGKWEWADATIDGSKIMLSANGISKPVQVQYAWQSNPVAPFYNTEGLPMVPFNEKISSK
jgi:sialate O-acetylesterase